MEEAKVLLKIIKSFIEDTKCPQTQEIEEKVLYQLAKKHKVENFLKEWAKTSCQSETIKNQVLASYHTQIIKDTNETIELEQILNKLEEAKIETFLIKGVTMKEVYSKDYMRQMCDIDLLVHSKDFKRASQELEKLGFDKFFDHEKHLVFQKKPFIFVELHRRLLLGDEVYTKYFNQIWSHGICYKNYQNIYRMNLEDTYVFCIIHLMYHFQSTGIKIRDILDVYLFNEQGKSTFDFEKLKEKLQKFEVKEFEKNIKQIAYKWFDSKKIDTFDDVEKFILKGAIAENQVNYEVGKNHGKRKYLVRMFFPKLKSMEERYPILKKLPILLPIMWLIRIFKKVFSKGSTLKEKIYKIKLIKNAKQENVKYIKEIHKKIGIVKKNNT